MSNIFVADDTKWKLKPLFFFLPDQDGAEPCANSASALNLLRLADFLDKDEWRDYAVKLLMVFGDRLSKIPIALPEMMCGLMYLQAKSKQVGVCAVNLIKEINDIFVLSFGYDVILGGIIWLPQYQWSNTEGY